MHQSQLLPSEGNRQSEKFPEPLLTYREAAALLRISERTLYSMVKDGRIPYVPIGRAVRFSKPALVQWLQGETRYAMGDSEAITKVSGPREG